jgi:triosephosphate isomerase (TIM)
MALRKLVAGNWKMFGSVAALAELDSVAQAAANAPGVDVAICPPFTLIAAAAARQPLLGIGAQDCHWAETGAHTGCVSAGMIKEAGATYVIVGHSERRADQHETSEQVRQKAEAARDAGLTAIVCVGESESERDRGDAVATVTRQVGESVPRLGNLDRLVIAYEPIWAIGTGRTPSVGDVAEMHAAIRQKLTEEFGEQAATLRILYGGSVKPGNAAELLHIENVDGALVGGASLKASDFNAIIAAA